MTVALVTGGGTGIGAAVARRLSADGFDVAVTGRRVGPIEDVAAKMRNDVHIPLEVPRPRWGETPQPTAFRVRFVYPDPDLANFTPPAEWTPIEAASRSEIVIRLAATTIITITNTTNQLSVRGPRNTAPSSSGTVRTATGTHCNQLVWAAAKTVRTTVRRPSQSTARSSGSRSRRRIGLLRFRCANAWLDMASL